MRAFYSGILGTLGLCSSLACGCGGTLGDVLTAWGAPVPAPLFHVPLAIEGEEIGTAIIDTGGGYEVMLRENFGLEVIDAVEVLAFGGRQSVEVTEGFAYSVGGFHKVATTAIVGESICDCNGLGFFFFRETGVVLSLDFVNVHAMFLSGVPAGGVTIQFEPPPDHLEGFDTAFIEVEVVSGGELRKTLGLLDTGANATLIRRGLVGSAPTLRPNRQDVTIANDYLGTVAVSAGLFDTDGLPDVIIGTDVMRVWANEWYFSYSPTGGRVAVFGPIDPAPGPVDPPAAD